MLHSSHSPKKATGFTLVELLVVMCIIGLLAAILFPVFSRVRENARRSTCQSNMKQIGLGMIQYIQDYDEILPSPIYGTTANGSESYYRWMDAVYPYTRSTQVFRCPSEGGRSANKNYARRSAPGGVTTSNGSYALNCGYQNSKLSPASFLDTKQTSPYTKIMAVVTVPAETAWVLESTLNSYELDWKNTSDHLDRIIESGPFPYMCDQTPSIDATMGVAEGVAARHLETTNVIWCDGHVKAVSLEYLKTKASNGNMRFFTTSND